MEIIQTPIQSPPSGEEHHDDITQWMIEKTVLFNSGDYEILHCVRERGNKNYESKVTMILQGRELKWQENHQTKWIWFPSVILDGDENVARRLVYETFKFQEEAQRRGIEGARNG